MKLLLSTRKQLDTVERMVECAYLNGFDFDENLGPRLSARAFVERLRHAIEQEMILARGKGVVATALIE
jgi:hypothetical protein